MDCNINYSNFRITANLSEKELVAEMVELYALCKAVPSTPRDQHGKITLLLQMAKRQEDSSPELKKIALKLTKTVADLPQKPLPLLMPNYGQFPLDATFTTSALYDVLHNISWPTFPKEDIFGLLEGTYRDERSASEKIVEELKRNSPEKVDHLLLLIKLKRKLGNKNQTFKDLLQLNNPELFKFIYCSHDNHSADSLISMSKDTLEAIHKQRLTILSMKRKFEGTKDKKIVIIGGGPGGLIRALYSMHLGYSVTILEKRDGSYTREAGSRPNILHLGHDQQSDLDELISFGIFDRLVLSGSISKSLYGGYQVAICDLEKEMAALVKEWQPEALVSSVQEINVTASASEKTVISYNTVSLPCDLLIIADGAKSSTARKLGVSYSSLSRTVHAPIGFFKGDESAHLKAFHVAKSVFTTLSSASSMIGTLSLEEIQHKLITKGILFRGRNEDYVGLSLSEEEENELTLLSNSEKLAAIREKLEIRQREIDLTLLIVGKNHTMRAGRLIETKIIPIQIKKAESPIFSVGKTLVLIRGDAHGTTHPASGYGAKTAIASLSAEKELLPYFEEAGINPLFIELFRREAENMLFLSQYKGFQALSLYRQNFKKRSYFFDLARGQNSVYRDLDVSLINRFYTVQKWRALTHQEIQSLHSLKLSIVEKYVVCTSKTEQEKYKIIFDEKRFPINILKDRFIHLQYITYEAFSALNPFEKAPPGSAKLLWNTAMKFITHPDSAALFGLVSLIEEIQEKNSQI